MRAYTWNGSKNEKNIIPRQLHTKYHWPNTNGSCWTDWRKNLYVENHVKFQRQQTVTVRAYAWNGSKNETISSQGSCIPNIIDLGQVVHVEWTGEKKLNVENHVKFQSQHTVTVRAYAWNGSKNEKNIIPRQLHTKYHWPSTNGSCWTDLRKNLMLKTM